MGGGAAAAALGVEDEADEECGVRGVRGLLENGRWGPWGVGRLEVAVAPVGLLTKMLAFSKLANDAWETGAAGAVGGSCFPVGEAKGSAGVREARGDWPRSDSKSREAEGRGPGSLLLLMLLLLLLFGGGLVMPDRLLPLLLTDPRD